MALRRLITSCALVLISGLIFIDLANCKVTVVGHMTTTTEGPSQKPLIIIILSVIIVILSTIMVWIMCQDKKKLEANRVAEAKAATESMLLKAKVSAPKQPALGNSQSALGGRQSSVQGVASIQRNSSTPMSSMASSNSNANYKQSPVRGVTSRKSSAPSKVGRSTPAAKGYKSKAKNKSSIKSNVGKSAVKSKN